MNPEYRLYNLCLIFTLLALVSACSTNPVTGQREIMLVSVAQETQLGAEAAKQIKEEMGLADNPALLKYVQTVGQRVAKFSPYREIGYQFQMVDTAEANAFALPGGYIYLSRGLMTLLNSEDELAGVIGHEIEHVAARHSAQRITRAAPVGLVTGITSKVTGIVSSSIAGTVSNVGSTLNSAILATYSRGQENDADAIGQNLAAQAGWNPVGLSHFLATLEREAALHEIPENSVAFLDTHPSTPERIKATGDRVAELNRGKYDPVAKDRNAFLMQLNGLKVGPDAKQGVFIKQKFLQPMMNFALSFPRDWQTQNNPQYVAAKSENDDSMLILQIQEQGTDATQAAHAFLDEAKIKNIRVESFKTGSLPAARIIISKGDQEAVITWIAFNKQIFRLIGVAASSKASNRQLFINTAATFHRLSTTERSKIKQLRLRIVSAKSSESLASLLERVGSQWDEKTCAIANNLKVEGILKGGQLVKVVLSEPLQ